MNYEQQKPPEAFDTPLAQLEKLRAEIRNIVKPIMADVNKFISKHPYLLKVLVVLDRIIYRDR